MFYEEKKILKKVLKTMTYIYRLYLVIFSINFKFLEYSFLSL